MMINKFSVYNQGITYFIKQTMPKSKFDRVLSSDNALWSFCELIYFALLPDVNSDVKKKKIRVNFAVCEL